MDKLGSQPELTAQVDVTIRDSDLRIDVFRRSV